MELAIWNLYRDTLRCYCFINTSCILRESYEAAPHSVTHSTDIVHVAESPNQVKRLIGTCGPNLYLRVAAAAFKCRTEKSKALSRCRNLGKRKKSSLLVVLTLCYLLRSSKTNTARCRSSSQHSSSPFCSDLDFEQTTAGAPEWNLELIQQHLEEKHRDSTVPIRAPAHSAQHIQPHTHRNPNFTRPICRKRPSTRASPR
jgi:hypothetical protein